MGNVYLAHRHQPDGSHGPRRAEDDPPGPRPHPHPPDRQTRPRPPSDTARSPDAASRHRRTDRIRAPEAAVLVTETRTHQTRKPSPTSTSPDSPKRR